MRCRAPPGWWHCTIARRGPRDSLLGGPFLAASTRSRSPGRGCRVRGFLTAEPGGTGSSASTDERPSTCCWGLCDPSTPWPSSFAAMVLLRSSRCSERACSSADASPELPVDDRGSRQVRAAKESCSIALTSLDSRGRPPDPPRRGHDGLAQRGAEDERQARTNEQRHQVEEHRGSAGVPDGYGLPSGCPHRAG